MTDVSVPAASAPVKASSQAKAVSAVPLRVLLYSDDVTVRERVRFAVGNQLEGRSIEFLDTATHEATVAQADTGRFDLLILDGEAAKSGGMGMCRQFKHELFDCPPIMVLVGRLGDAWLATWCEADAAVAHPLDPFQVREAVAGILMAKNAA